MKRIALDRFPLSTYKTLKKELEMEKHKIVLSILTFESKNKIKNKKNLYFDRDIALGFHNNIPWNLSQEEVENAAKYEGIALKLFARYDVGQKNFTAHDMSTHFFQLINFWTNQIKTKKLTTCMHYYLPHDPSSFTFYIACKLNKVEVMFIDVPILFNDYRYISCSFRQRNLMLRNGEIKNKFDFRKYSDIYNKNIVDGNIQSISKPIKKLQEGKKLFTYRRIKKLFILIFSLENLFKLNKIFHKRNTFFKNSKNSWHKKESDFNYLYFFVRNFVLFFELKIKNNKYNKRCIDIPKKSFVYFAMSAQPEATTLPTAMEYADTINVLKILREGIPKNIPILVKENPAVFLIRNPYLSLVSYRSPDFYDNIENLGNIHFVNTKTDSRELIKKSILTACISGTAAIEAANLGKISLIFAPNWFDSIKSIFLVRTPEEVNSAFKKIGKISTKSIISSSEDFDRDVMIKFEKHNSYEFALEDREEVIKAFKNALIKFPLLNNKKWMI